MTPNDWEKRLEKCGSPFVMTYADLTHVLRLQVSTLRKMAASNEHAFPYPFARGTFYRKDIALFLSKHSNAKYYKGA